MIFKKKKQSLLWNYLDRNLDGYFDISDYFVKSTNNLPDWYKKVKAVKSIPFKDKGFAHSASNVKTCPSFVDLFKNSLVFKCPIDIDIEVGMNGMDYTTPTESHHMLTVTTHTLIKEKSGSQMGKFWDDTMQNIKLSLPITMWASHKKTKMIFLPNTYFDPRQELQVAPGIADLLPDNPLQMAVNFFVDLKGLGPVSTKTINLKNGQPLGLIYFPGGLPQIERGYTVPKLRKNFFGDWISRIKKYDEKNQKKSKCPFHF